MDINLKVISIFSCILFCISLQAQDLGMYHYNINNKYYSYGSSIVYYNDSLVISNNFVSNSNQTDSLQQYLFRINNTNGLETNYKIYDTKYYPFATTTRQSMSIDNKGNIYIAGYAELVNDSLKAVVIRIKANGKIDWEKQYNTYQYASANSPMVLNDNEIVFDIDYSINKISYNLQEYVWIDSTGAVLKRKKVPIESDLRRIENPNSMLLADGGIITTAQAYTHPPGTPKPYHRLVRLDKDGNIKWQIRLDRIDDDNSPTLVCPLQNGNFIAVSPWLNNVEYTTPDGKNVWEPTRLYLIDSTGKILKTNDISSYGLQLKYRPGNIFPLSNGDVCIMGDGRINIDIPNNKALFAGFLARVSPDLEYKWKRFYFDSTAEAKFSYLYDGTELPNGDLAMCGELFGKNHDLWVLKVDSNGCILPNCSVADTSFIWTSVEDHGTKENISYLRLYPNPTNGTMRIMGIDADTYISEINIMNMNGTREMQLKPNERLTSSGLNIDVSNLDNGVYVLQAITKAGAFYIGKFVVMKQ